jgi:hypothetical protein
MPHSRGHDHSQAADGQTLQPNVVIIQDGGGHYLKIPVLTTAQRNALAPTNGQVIYNSTTGLFESYQNGVWKQGVGYQTIGTAIYYSSQSGNAYQYCGILTSGLPSSAIFPQGSVGSQVRLVATMLNTGVSPSTFYLSYASYDMTPAQIEPPSDARSGSLLVGAGAAGVFDTGWITIATPSVIAAIAPETRGTNPGDTWEIGNCSVSIR